MAASLLDPLSWLLSGQRKWTRRSVPDMSGTTAVVTGFNSGIGLEVSRILLEHNAEVSCC